MEWNGMEFRNLELPSPETQNSTTGPARSIYSTRGCQARSALEIYELNDWIGFLCVFCLSRVGGNKTLLELNGSCKEIEKEDGLRCIIASWPLLLGSLIEYNYKLSFNDAYILCL